MHLDLQLNPVWNVEVQLIGSIRDSETLCPSVYELRQQFLSETALAGQVMEVSTISKSSAQNCTTLYRAHQDNEIKIPRFFFCNLLFIHIFTDNTVFTNMFVNGTDCLVRPKCNPLHNWHYVFISGIKEQDALNQIQIFQIPKTVRAVIQNALLFQNTGMDPFYLVRDKWIRYKKAIEINPKRSGTATAISKIKEHASKQICNYNLEEFYVISPYPLYPSFKKGYKGSILRGEEFPNHNLLSTFAIIKSVNATPIPPLGPSKGANYLIAELLRHPNSIAIPLGVNEERWKMIEYSQIFAMSYVSFITHSPRLADNNFMFLIEPFHLPVWLSLGVSFFAAVVAGVLLLLPFLNSRQVTKVINNGQGIASQETTWLKACRRSAPFVMKTLILPLIDQSSEMKEINANVPLQAVVGIWILSGIVLGSLYRSSMVSCLVQPSFIRPPLTFKDLIRSDYSIRLSPGFSNLSILALQNELTALSGMDAHERLKISSEKERSQCFTDIENGNNACICFDFIIDVLARLFLTDALGEDLFVLSQDKVLPTVSAIPINPLSDIKPTADKVISQLLASGLMDKWLSILSDFNTQQGRKNAGLKNASNATEIGDDLRLQLVSFTIIVYPVYLLIFGFLAGLVSFAYEYYVF